MKDEQERVRLQVGKVRDSLDRQGDDEEVEWNSKGGKDQTGWEKFCNIGLARLGIISKRSSGRKTERV